MVKVRVDADLCVGHGRCYVLAPDVFGADEFGHCIVLEEQVDGALEVAGAHGRRELSGASDHHRAIANRSAGESPGGSAMQDVLGYAGKRVIVSGAASGMGAATAELLVELGAEVHAIDIKKPDVSGLASFTETDLREPDADRRRGRQDRRGRRLAVQLRGPAQHVLEPRRDARELLRPASPHRARDPEHRRGRRDREHRVVGRVSAGS